MPSGTVVPESQQYFPICNGVRLNKHTRFHSEDSGNSDYSDSIAKEEDSQERRVRDKLKRKLKRKQAKSDSVLPDGVVKPHKSSATKVMRSRERRAKEGDRRIVSEGDVTGEVEWGQTEVNSFPRVEMETGERSGCCGKSTVMANKKGTPVSGLKQIMEEQRLEREMSRSLAAERDPIKEFEASKLFGVQSEAGFNFTVVEGVKKRMVLSEEADFKNRMKRVIVNDQ
jgi:hypothetical protein